MSASAATSASDMAVTADLNANCTMSTTDLAFGTYDPIVANAALDLRATATVSTTCTSGATSVVLMSAGLHKLYCLSSKCHRQMANAGETSFLRYNIYTNASYAWGSVWTDDSNDTATVGRVTGSGVSQDLTIYGEIPKNQNNVSPGTYADTVTVTLAY